MNDTDEEISWRVYIKSNRGLLIIGVLFFLIGIYTDIQWISERQSGMLYFLNLLPGIFLISVWFSAARYQKRRWLIIIAGMLITFVITLFVFFMNAITGAFSAASTPITDVAKYNEFLEQMGNSELIRHFPLSIPDSAEIVRFEYLPKFLQGGGHSQLRMKLPQSEIIDMQKEFRPQAKFIFIGGNTNDHENKSGGVPTTFFYTSETDDQSFKDDYEILVLNAEPNGNPDFQWNHGFSYGVAISLERSEIIYWTEYW